VSPKPGPPPAGLIKATAGIATLLMEGIGDTIRYSLTADPVEEAGRVASCSKRSACASARTST
jgi:4-hydroxy-3-methylbut-2-en-1-yl diphosphate synthase IspG/GcpE